MPPRMPTITLLEAPDWSDYELLDSGSGQKLERFGAYTFIRPEHQAVWAPALPATRWQAAYAVFLPAGGEETGGKWENRRPLTADWPMTYKGLKFLAHHTSSRHLGVFPEQAAHWDWMSQLIARARRPLNVLNLFGYTGLATLAAAQAGASVTHVDAARKSVGWARQNQTLSGLQDRPVRWIVDDALKFVQREARRGVCYDGLLLDPPKFGRGPKGEVWDFFTSLPVLLQACRAVLSPRPVFVVITAYAIRASALSLYYSLQAMMSGLAGSVTAGELVASEKSAGRLLSMAIYARWQAELW